MNLGGTIRELRIKKKLRQKEVAEKCNISQNYLSQIENEQRMPAVDILERISSVLEIPFPVLSFLSLEDKDISSDKIDAFRLLEPKINSLIEDLFLA